MQLVIKTSFFDEVNNGVVVNAISQLSNERDSEIFFFRRCPTSRHIPVICALLLLEVRKIHRLAGHHHKVSM